jgi:hypothetical protein
LKCGQNSSQNIKNQIENPIHLHPTFTKCQNEYHKPSFGTDHLSKNVKSAQVKVAKWQKFAQSGHTDYFPPTIEILAKHFAAISILKITICGHAA